MLLLMPVLILHGLVLLTNAASIKDYPWVVAIYRHESFKPTKLLCGGSVITHRSVLTSSRCLLLAQFNEITVKAGSQELTDGEGVWYDAEDIFTHPNATTIDSLHWINDVGLVFVIGYFGNNVQPIPTSVVPTDRAMQIEVQGYGTLFPEFHDGRNKFMSRKLFIRPSDICVDQSEKIYHFRQQLDSHQKCTIDPNSNHDTCVMTVGGPVTICGILVGVVSWGSTCNHKDAIILFTDVSWYNGWIYDVTKSIKY